MVYKGFVPHVPQKLNLWASTLCPEVLKASPPHYRPDSGPRRDPARGWQRPVTPGMRRVINADLCGGHANGAVTGHVTYARSEVVNAGRNSHLLVWLSAETGPMAIGPRHCDHQLMIVNICAPGTHWVLVSCMHTHKSKSMLTSSSCYLVWPEPCRKRISTIPRNCKAIN